MKENKEQGLKMPIAGIELTKQQMQEIEGGFNLPVSSESANRIFNSNFEAAQREGSGITKKVANTSCGATTVRFIGEGRHSGFSGIAIKRDGQLLSLDVKDGNTLLNYAFGEGTLQNISR
ncbi:MAG: hypothetical protein FWB72_06520 [Firmicutes bacterium]|nr:hypothetical protein [Bacillota bacterium]MCL2177573.1 hypothetical protein [Bacillota bacterium]